MVSLYIIDIVGHGIGCDVSSAWSVFIATILGLSSTKCWGGDIKIQQNS